MRSVLLRALTAGLALALGMNAALAQEKWAGVEVGSKGVKFVLLEVKEVDGERTTTLMPERKGKDEVKNTALNESAAVTQSYSEEAMKATAAAVKAFVEEARTLEVPDEHIFVVGSSGLKDARNREEFRTLIMDETGKKIEFIKAADEAALTFLGVTAADEREKAYSFDVGSGNTKFGYAKSSDDGLVFVGSQIIWATGTFRDAVKNRVKFTDETDAAQCASEFGQASLATREELKVEAALDEAKAKVDLDGRDQVFLSGGIVWALATMLKPETINDDNVTLEAADIQTFRLSLLQATDRVFAKAEDRIEQIPEADREKAKAELAKVKAVFANAEKVKYPVVHAELISGTDVLLAAAGVFEFGDRKLVFPRKKGLTAWIRSYVDFNADIKIVDTPFVAEAAPDQPAAPVPAPTPKPPAEENPAAAPVADAGLAKKIDALTAAIAALQKKLDDHDKDFDSVAVAVGNLRKETAALKEANENQQQTADLVQSQLRTLNEAVKTLGNPDAAPVAPADAAEAQRLFFSALENYRAGRYSDAYVMITRAADGHDLPKYWYARALVASQVGNQKDFRASCDRVTRALRQGRTDPNQLARAFESIQGPGRIAVEAAIRKAP